MTPREVEEYRALRATIRDRGTMRVWLFLAAIAAWAAATIATAALAALPVATLLPLLVLASGFETVFNVHTGVERIGRYLQVFYAPGEAERDWERTVMAYGLAYPGAGSGSAVFTVFLPGHRPELRAGAAGRAGPARGVGRRRRASDLRGPRRRGPPRLRTPARARSRALSAPQAGLSRPSHGQCNRDPDVDLQQRSHRLPRRRERCDDI